MIGGETVSGTVRDYPRQSAPDRLGNYSYATPPCGCSHRQGQPLYLAVDNDAVHKHPKVRAWLARHPRWVFHFTPISCSWANAVEGFFATLTRRRLQRGVFHSLVDLQAAINRYLGEHNRKPKPFVWTADPDRIIERSIVGTKRSRQTTRSHSRDPRSSPAARVTINVALFDACRAFICS